MPPAFIEAMSCTGFGLGIVDIHEDLLGVVVLEYHSIVFVHKLFSLQRWAVCSLRDHYKARLRESQELFSDFSKKFSKRQKSVTLCDSLELNVTINFGRIYGELIGSKLLTRTKLRR